MTTQRCQPTTATPHTPTPWYHRQAGEASKSGDPYDWIADSPEHGKHRKIIVTRDACDPADYAFIVEAVNSHAALVKALEEIARQHKTDEMCEAEVDDADFENAYDIIIGRARSALKEISK